MVKSKSATRSLLRKIPDDLFDAGVSQEESGIEYGIPLPPRTRSRDGSTTSSYHIIFSKMKVGGSYLFFSEKSEKDFKLEKQKETGRRVASVVQSFKKIKPNWELKYRTRLKSRDAENGVRVWRTK